MNRNIIIFFLLILMGCNEGSTSRDGQGAQPMAQSKKLKAQSDRPNIILIMSDDMGYSDVGCYGSEIPTPNIDALAENGIRFTQFYNMARCCPTRASLMTGLYPHQAGLGWMTAVDHELPGYGAELNNDCVTIAEALQETGYSTYMTGKWHLAKYNKENVQQYNWPLQRGFEKFYGIILGASNYYDPGVLCRDNTPITPFTDPEYKSPQYYFTDAISDNSVAYIRKRDKEKPFFMYVAYTAAHWPMQAPEDAILKNKGVYDRGWEEVRKNRLEKMKRLGVVSPDVQLPEWNSYSWEEEKNKAAAARRMETYSAMIQVMDNGIGRIIQSLKDEGVYDNTVILYLQDNGACAETIGLREELNTATDTAGLRTLEEDGLQKVIKPGITRDGRIVMQGTTVMAGPADTYVAYGKEWATVSNTPLREYKHWVHEGGIATPLIVQWKNGIESRGEFRQQPGHLIDIMPTVLELAQGKYPSTYKDHAITPAAGVSLVPCFSNEQLSRKAIFWEHEMNRAVRMGKWKIVSEGELSGGPYGKWKYFSNGPWELYNIEADRNELNNLASGHPEIVEEMANMWMEYARKTKVFPAPWAEAINKAD